MLIIALVLALIGLVALVFAVVTSNELVAWVCIGASVLGVVLLIIDAVRERQQGDAAEPETDDEAPDDVPDDDVPDDDVPDDEAADDADAAAVDYPDEAPDADETDAVQTDAGDTDDADTVTEASETSKEAEAADETAK